jgi:hypothetical protein
MDQTSIKHTNIFHCKALQNLPKLRFLVWKYTIWQPWPAGAQKGKPQIWAWTNYARKKGSLDMSVSHWSRNSYFALPRNLAPEFSIFLSLKKGNTFFSTWNSTLQDMEQNWLENSKLLLSPKKNFSAWTFTQKFCRNMHSCKAFSRNPSFLRRLPILSGLQKNQLTAESAKRQTRTNLQIDF